MRKSYYFKRNCKYSRFQANNYFAQVARAWSAISEGLNVQFVEGGVLKHAKVVGKWGGLDPRIVAVDDSGTKHYIRNIDGLMALSTKVGGYIPAIEYGNLAAK